MHSPSVLAHFRQPRGAGPLPGANAVGRAENPICGDVLEVSLRLEGGVIAEARFRAQSCVATIACASHLTDRIGGLSTAQALAITAASLTETLGGLPDASAHAAQLAIDALGAAVRAGMPAR